MQVVLNANKASPVQTALTEGGTVSLSYAVPLSYPNISKASVKLVPQITFPPGNPHTQSQTFIIPRTQYNYAGMLEFRYTKNFIDVESDNFNIMNVIRSIQFQSNSQPILTIDGDAYKAMVMNSPPSLQDFIYRSSKALNVQTLAPETGASVAPDNVYVSYLPLFASWYQDIEKALNTQLLAQISVEVSYKGATECGIVAAEPLTNFTSKLTCYKYQPDEKTDAIMVARDFSNPDGMLMECFNTITERNALSAGASTLAVPTVVTMTSEVRNPVYKTHVYVAKTNVGTTAPLYGCAYVPIRSISVDVGGSQYLVDYTKFDVNYEQALKGMANHNITPAAVGADSPIVYNKDQCFTIDWSLGGHRDSNTGLASFANLNKPVFKVTLGPVVVDDTNSYSLYLVHEYWNIVKVDGSSRTMSITQSW